MQDVIERFKALKKDRDYYRGRLTGEGRRAGDSWARQHAGIEEMERLSDFDGPAASKNFMEVFGVMYPDRQGDREAAKIFWSHQTSDGNGLVDDLFVAGFVAGALAVWAEVKPALDDPAPPLASRPSRPR